MLKPRPLAIRHRAAEQDVVLAAGAIQQRPERRQQQHVRRHPGRPAQLAHSFGELAVEDEVVCVPLEGLHRCARPVSW